MSAAPLPRLVRARELRALLGAQTPLTRSEFAGLRKSGLIQPIRGTRLYNLEAVRAALNSMISGDDKINGEEAAALKEASRWAA